MLMHRDFSAWIVSNNQPLPEYLVAVDEKGSRVSCWIPSEAGKQFSVHWRDHGSNVHTCSFISLDGFVVPGRFLYGTGSASREGVRSGPTSERPFIFAEYRDPSSSGDCNRNAGTIMLKIKRVRLEGHKRANPFQTIPDGSSRATISGHCVGAGMVTSDPLMNKVPRRGKSSHTIKQAVGPMSPSFFDIDLEVKLM